jgi:uncharacterized membrane protein (DUF2068 family)
LRKKGNEKVTQQNSYRLIAIPAIILGLFSIKEGGSVLLGLSTKTYPVLPWLVRYNVVMGFLSVIAGVGLWMQRGWGSVLAAMMLLCHGIVFLSLMTLIMLGKTVARISIMAMLFRTAIWLVIYMVLRWKSDTQASNA